MRSPERESVDHCPRWASVYLRPPGQWEREAELQAPPSQTCATILGQPFLLFFFIVSFLLFYYSDCTVHVHMAARGSMDDGGRGEKNKTPLPNRMNIPPVFREFLFQGGIASGTIEFEIQINNSDCMPGRDGVLRWLPQCCSEKGMVLKLIEYRKYANVLFVRWRRGKKSIQTARIWHVL